MGDERCETCKFWGASTPIVLGDVKIHNALCRRFPHAVRGPEMAPRDRQPLTSHDDWCGEWRGKGELTPPEPAILNEPAFAVLEMGSRLRKVAEQLLGTAATVRQVCDTPSYDWLTARNSGQATLDELRRELARHGLRLCDMPMWMPNS